MNLFKKAVQIVKKPLVAGVAPLKMIKTNPKSLFMPKDLYKNGRGIANSFEYGLSNLNPLKSPLTKFDKMGIKHGGIGRTLGGLGEAANKRPGATIALGYGAWMGGAWVLANSDKIAVLANSTVGKGLIKVAVTSALKGVHRQRSGVGGGTGELVNENIHVVETVQTPQEHHGFFSIFTRFFDKGVGYPPFHKKDNGLAGSPMIWTQPPGPMIGK